MDETGPSVNHENRNNGHALVEVLVSVALLASVLSGFAASQSRAMGISALAGFRSQAVLSVSDIIERMRANPDGVGNGFYEFNMAGRIPGMDCSNPGSKCSSAEIAALDLWTWSDRISHTLPDGIGNITIMSDGPAWIYRVTVGWVRKSGVGALSKISPAECDRELQRMHCYGLEVTF